MNVSDATLYKRCLSFLGLLESERLHDELLAVAAEAVGASGGVLWTGTGELVLAAVRGLAAAGRRLDPIHVDGDLGARLQSGDPFMWPEMGEPGATLRVPVLTGPEPGKVVGMIELTDKVEQESFTEEDLRRARIVAECAGVALSNVARVTGLKRRSLKDPETGTYNLLYFVEYAAKEIYKARRYGRKFSLIVVKVDNLHKLRAMFSPDVVSELVGRLVEAIRGALRDADLVAKVVDDEFYILLPETDYLGARLFIQKIQRSFRRARHASDLERTHPVLVSCGAAAFPRDGHDYDELLGKCQDQIDMFRNSLHRKLHLGDLSLWQLVELFVGKEDWYRNILEELPPKPLAVTEDSEARSRHLVLDASLYRRVQREALEQVARSRHTRGVLYLGVRQQSDLETLSPVAAGLVGGNTSGFVLARPDVVSADVPGLTVLNVEDPELGAHELTLLMTESANYAFVGRHTAEGAIYGYHTSDPILVETLVAKLQNQYYLQGRF